MMSLLNIDDDYCDVITSKKEKIRLISLMKHYLSLRRPMDEKEKKEFNDVSTLIQLQSEIDDHRKRRNKYIKKLTNEGILVV